MKTLERLQPTLWPEMELPLMSSAVGSPVKTLASLEKALALRVNDLVSGRNIGELFATCDPNGSSLKTCQQSFLGEGQPLPMTLPRAGMIVSGNAYQRQPLARPTDGIDGGVLPTPLAADANKADCTLPAIKRRQEKGQTISLAMTARLWPTPVARDSRTIKGAARAPNATGSEPLTVVVGQIENTTDGALNPTWAEWLMGFPSGWTDLEDSGTPLSLKFQKSSAEPS